MARKPGKKQNGACNLSSCSDKLPLASANVQNSNLKEKISEFNSISKLNENFQAELNLPSDVSSSTQLTDNSQSVLKYNSVSRVNVRSMSQNLKKFIKSGWIEPSSNYSAKYLINSSGCLNCSNEMPYENNFYCNNVGCKQMAIKVNER